MATGNGCAVGLSSGQGFGEDTVKMTLKVNTGHQAEATLRLQAFLQLDDVNRSHSPLHALEEGRVFITG